MSEKQLIAIFSKIGFLLIIFGFMMPVSCNQNGLQIINYAFNAKATLLALVLIGLFIFSLIGLVISIINSMKKTNDKYLVYQILSSFLSPLMGLIAYIKGKGQFSPNIGVYIIALGWYLAIAFSISEYYKTKK